MPMFQALFRRTIIALSLCLLAACASVGNVRSLTPGVSTEADASRLTHRQPGRVWDNKDGTRTLEYSNEPYNGFECFMVTVDAKGIVRKVEQVITDTNISRVQRGQHHDDVQRLLGEPRTVQRFPLSGEEVWDWNVSADVDAIERFNAHFKEGVLVRTSTRRVDVSSCSLGCN